MSLAPPTLDNPYRIGQILWRLTGHGRASRLSVWQVVDLCHHYAQIRQPVPDSLGRDRWTGPAEAVDARLLGCPYRDPDTARENHQLATHPLGDLAYQLLNTGAKEARRCTEWRDIINPGKCTGPQTYAAALRLLCRLGRAERLPTPKRCPRYRLLLPVGG